LISRDKWIQFVAGKAAEKFSITQAFHHIFCQTFFRAPLFQQISPASATFRTSHPTYISPNRTYT
jgi:hypothetical protein